MDCLKNTILNYCGLLIDYIYSLLILFFYSPYGYELFWQFICQNLISYPYDMNFFKIKSGNILEGSLHGAMATHSSTLAWKIPWMEEPGGLQSMGSLRVRHDWATSLSLFTFIHWRGKWQPTPVFLPGDSQGWGSLVGCHLWGRTELDTTEATEMT